MNNTVPWPSPESLHSSFLCQPLLVFALGWIMAGLAQIPACGWEFPGLRVQCLLPHLNLLVQMVMPLAQTSVDIFLIHTEWRWLCSVGGKQKTRGKDLLANLINVLMFPPFFPMEIVYWSDHVSLVIVTVCVNFFSCILGSCISQQGAKLIFSWFDGFSSRARDRHFHLCFLAAPTCSLGSASGAPLALNTMPGMKVVIGGGREARKEESKQAGWRERRKVAWIACDRRVIFKLESLKESPAELLKEKM